MPFNSRQVREYAGGSSTGGILRKESSNTGITATPNLSATPGGAAINTATNYGEAKQIDLLVFGYACKIFRDDDKAREIDQGKHLIPWMGDGSLKIDRYDVRGALYDLSPHEAPPGGYGNRLDYLNAEELRAEQLCEEERYLFLYKNEEQHILHQEEELKRFKQESSGYSQIGYAYDGASSSSNGGGVQHGPSRENFSNSPTCDEADEEFTLPTNFTVPPSIQLPETMKQHAIIEKTARFIASQGVQMEILLKAKQSNNLQFEFLTQNSLLNNYYKFVLNAIKDGTYPAEEAPKENVNFANATDNEGDNMKEIGSTRPIITVPTIKYKPSANCAYTQLISKIKGVPLPAAVDESTAKVSSIMTTSLSAAGISHTNTTPNEENFTPVLLQYNGNTFVTEDETNSQDAVNKITTNSPPKVEILKNSSALLLAQGYSSGSDSEVEDEKSTTPPPEPKLTFPIPTDNLKNIIDKTATYVIKNGRQFEETLRTKSEERFTFLLPENEFYPYYMYKITGDPNAATIEQKTRRAAAVAAALISKQKLNVEKNSGPVSFSIKSKDEQPISGLQPALPQEASDDDEDSTNKQTNSSADNTQQQRTVPEHVKKAIQLVESQLIARNAQLAAAVGAAVLPCNLPNMRSRFDIDYTGQLTSKPIPVWANAEMERNALFEQQQQNRVKELKRAEEKVKDKLAQIAREKLGGLITKEKQLQLERKRKAMAFLNQIKGSSENESTPDKRPTNDDADASENSDASVHSIPITSYGPDDKSDEDEPPPTTVMPPSMPITKLITASKTSTPNSSTSDNVKISAAVTVSDDDDVELISETKFSDYVASHKHRSSHLKRHRRSRSGTRDSHTTTTEAQKYHIKSKRKSSVVSSDDDEIPAATVSKSRSHKSAKLKKSASSSKSHSKKKAKKRSHMSRSRSRSHSSSRHRSKSHHRSRSQSTYLATSPSRYSRSASEESVTSRNISKRHQHKRSKHKKRSRTPTRKEKSRKHVD